MIVLRSTRCALTEMTAAKRATLERVLAEYGRVANFFIGKFWTRRWSKRELTKETIEVPDTWLSARLRKVAAREAIDMVRAARERDGRWAHQPQHQGRRMHVSSTIAALEPAAGTSEFDAWLHLASLGGGIRLDLPVRYHRHFHRLAGRPGALRAESYLITVDSVQLAFRFEIDEPKVEGPVWGLDSGARVLATLSDGRQFGRDVGELLDRIARRRHGSRGQERARRALRQRFSEVAKEVASLGASVLVAEDLKRLHQGTRRDRRLARGMRRRLGAWAYRGWLSRLEGRCQTNRVRLVCVPPAYSSLRCSACGHTEKANRKAEVLRCRACGYTDDADVNAARNLRIRFLGREPELTGAYGPGFQPRGVE